LESRHLAKARTSSSGEFESKGNSDDDECSDDSDPELDVENNMEMAAGGGSKRLNSSLLSMYSLAGTASPSMTAPVANQDDRDNSKEVLGGRGAVQQPGEAPPATSAFAHSEAAVVAVRGDAQDRGKQHQQQNNPAVRKEAPTQHLAASAAELQQTPLSSSRPAADREVSSR